MTAVVITNGTTVIVIKRSTIARLTTSTVAVLPKLRVRGTARRTKTFPKTASNTVHPMDTIKTADNGEMLVLEEFGSLGEDSFIVAEKKNSVTNKHVTPTSETKIDQS